MEIYIIALKELKISNNIILKILDLFQLDDYLDLFKGNYIKLQFKYGLELDKYDKIFINIDSLTKAFDKAKEIKSLSKKNKIKILMFNNKDYPENLKTIDNPPPILYYKGRKFYPKHSKSIACVGTRDVTNFGIGAVESIVPKLVSEGFTIVSGLADGVDSLSHKKCIENNGTTIAVLAHGLDTIYPKKNEELAADILNHNGILLSEYPVGTPPDRFRFVDRNRIIAGLSKGTIVFESKEKSGTMHTVRYTKGMNRPVFCPMPLNSTLTTSVLSKMIDEGTAISIPNRNAFEVVVSGTNYKLKDKEKILKLKNKASAEIINVTRIDSMDIFETINFNEFKYSGIKVDRDLHEKYKHIINSKGLSNKDLFNAFMLSVVKAYDVNNND